MSKQIYYSDWSDKLASGHESYWEDINDIATWMGYAMEGYHNGHRVSTIRVMQTKEKFGEVRIYVALADEEFVKEKYEKYSIKTTLEEYAEKCYLTDCKHYRDVYMAAKRWWPQYWEAISSGADYSEFLCENPQELGELVGRCFSKDPKFEKENKRRLDIAMEISGFKSLLPRQQSET